MFDAKQNLSIIRTALDIAQAGRVATETERSLLSSYTGWGTLAGSLADDGDHENPIHRELTQLLSPDALRSLRRTVLDAYYTPQAIVHAIWTGFERMGFCGGTVLEPSFGTGAFLSHAPASIREHLRVTGIEKDATTCQLARLIHPHAEIVERAFEETALHDGSFDVAVGNPPYADIAAFDPVHPKLRDSIHAFMIAKSMLKVRAGGLGGFVVSRYFLDGSGEARNWLRQNTRLIAAFRLPAQAFEKDAGVSVMTDVVFLQRTSDAVQANPDEWGSKAPFDLDVDQSMTINRYFLDHPEYLLGLPSSGTDRFGKPSLILTPSANGWAQDLQAALADLPANVYNNSVSAERKAIDPAIEAEDADGSRTRIYGYSFDCNTGEPVQRVPDHAGQPCWCWASAIKESQYARLRSLLELRDTLRALLDAESGTTHADIASLRTELNQRYDAHLRAFKALHAQGNRNVFSADPDYSFLLGLELNYDPGMTTAAAEKNDDVARPPSWVRADIFDHRVVHPENTPEPVTTAEGALMVSLRDKGRVSLDYMATVSGLSTQQLKRDLSGELFRIDPHASSWVTRAEYLSGNVVAKLVRARQWAESNPVFSANVEALVSVQPPLVEPEDIHAPLGASWIPGAVIAAFVEHLCEHPPKETPIYVVGQWVIEMPNAYALSAATNESTWGTQDRPFTRLLPRLLNNRSLKVVRSYPDGSTETDIEATQAAEEKADAIRNAWADWLWNDAERRATLSDLYNGLFNTHVPRTYNGQFLLDADRTLPGSSRHFAYDPHQINAAWRMVCERFVLADHVVGAGKTLTAITAAMIGRRAGQIRKPLFVVPGHLVGQWADEFVRAFPTARVLALSESEFDGSKRSSAFARIAMNDWDAVIIPHSSFGFIDMPAHKKSMILDAMFDDVQRAIEQISHDKGQRLTVRQLERIKAKIEERIKRLTSGMRKDETVSFDHMGIDAVFVDEFHKSFKNLMYFTEHHNVGGLGAPLGSMRALDLFVKARWLAERNGSLVLLSGTPISNSVVELFTVLRLLAYDDLEQKGIEQFDAWASTFAVPTTGYELSSTGNYQIKTRFRSFNNVPELMRIYRTYADVVHTADLRATCEARGEEWPTPNLRTGKPIMVHAARSPLQKALMDTILERANNLGTVDTSVDNALKIFTDAGKIALDPRLYVDTTDDFPDSKINLCVRNTMEEYRRWSAHSGTQLIFCDMGTPKPQEPMRFTVYSDLRTKLIASGIPAREIAFIHEANTPRRKRDLFRAVRSGEVRVLIGTTAKMGEGMNVQDRLVAIHDLDAPFRPSDIEQRLGRIVRRGNQLRASVPGFEVSAYRYGTKLTLDAMRWQILETKAHFINQVRKGNLTARSISDVDGEDTETGFAAMKAELSGNPLILEHFQLSERLKRVENLQRAHRRSVWHAESSVQRLQDYLQRRDQRLADLAQDRAVMAPFPELTFQADSDAAGLCGADMNAALNQHISQALQAPELVLRNKGVLIGWFNGLPFTLTMARRGYMHFYLEGRHVAGEIEYEPQETIVLSGLKRRVQNLVTKIEGDLEGAIHRRAAQDASDLAQYQAIINQPCPRDTEILELRDRIHGIERSLAKQKQPAPDDSGSTVDVQDDESPTAPVANPALAAAPEVASASAALSSQTVRFAVGGFQIMVSPRIRHPARAA